jgi:hypothetical protein
MAYTKYSLTPADNNTAPPNGAPEGMLPSAVNDTMRDMMSQIRDAGDGIRDGTYTMTAAKITGGTITGVALTGNTFTSPVISGGSINNTPIGATTASTGAFSTLSATGATTFSGATVISGSLTANTFSSSGATITGGTITVASSSDTLGNLRNIPINSKTTGYTLLVTDNGQCISITTGGVTVPNSVFSAGQTVAIFNNSASNQTITQGAGVTMYLGGTATTGNRTLAGYGLVTILFITSSTVVITGAGVS